MKPIDYIFILLLAVVVYCMYKLYLASKESKELYRDLAINRDKVHTLEVKLHNTGKPDMHTTWQHTNGVVYEVIGYANLKSTNLSKYPVSIIYKNMKGDVWVRPLSDWHRSFTAYKP